MTAVIAGRGWQPVAINPLDLIPEPYLPPPPPPPPPPGPQTPEQEEAESQVAWGLLKEYFEG
jgi:hypothetical protein